MYNREVLRIFLLVFPLVGLPIALGAQTVDLPRHQLVFSRQADADRSDYDLWTMCGDGTQLASLVVEPGEQFQLTVSPDGTEFVYTNRTQGARDLWRRPFGRGVPVNLTDHPAEDSQPAWSPDGARLAFFSDRDVARLELYVLDFGTGTIQRLTHNEYYEGGAAWSPDGREIAFTRYFPGKDGQSGAGEIVRIDVVTRAETQVTRLGGYNGSPTYSPDGSRIAFHRTSEVGSDLWIVGRDGANAQALTETALDEYSPSWSPDGEWIAFTAGSGDAGQGTFDLWIVRPDGSGRRVLNPAQNTETNPTWRPGESHCR